MIRDMSRPLQSEEEIVQFYMSALVDMRNFLLDYANQFSIVRTNRRLRYYYCNRICRENREYVFMCPAVCPLGP